jgi:signal transduction histidine kinase
MRASASASTSKEERSDRGLPGGAAIPAGGAVTLGAAAGRASSATSRLPIERFRARRRARDTRVVSAAVARERARIAADVHDLVMQDLALALAMARTLAADPANPEARSVAAAGERAMAGAREIMAGLLAKPRTPVCEAVASSVRAAARRVPVRFDAHGVPDGAEPDEPTFDTLVHIGREAVTNAVKHGSPGSVEVVLAYEDEWRLSVCDDGRGFDAGTAPHGFGLLSMAQQARALGGALVVSSTAGSGTVIEAVLP